MRSKHSDTNTEQAEVLALDGLTYLASDPQRFSRFLGLSGIDTGDLAAAASDPHVLAGVLDYLLQHEALLLDWCHTCGHMAHDVKSSRRKLPGFEEY